MTTAHFFHSSDQNIIEIYQIVISTKVANLTKRVVRCIVDLTMIAKKKTTIKEGCKCKTRQGVF